MKKKCLVLLSGGLDSVTTLAYAKSCNFDVSAVTFKYGQNHAIETEFACFHANKYSNSHKILDVTSVFANISSALINGIVDTSDARNLFGVPGTYVPCRNIIFLTVASGIAETMGITDIYIGVNAIDYSGYPDCRPEFISSFESMINVGSAHARGNFRIQTPLIDMPKWKIIELGTNLGVDYSQTLSCYSPVGKLACGKCHSCQIRLAGFRDAGIKDPAEYI